MFFFENVIQSLELFINLSKISNVMNSVKFLIPILVLLFMLACKKEEDIVAIDSDAEMLTAIDHQRGESESNMIFTMSKGGLDRRLSAKNSGIDSLDLPACATEFLDTLSMPRVYEVDYGNQNCLCWDGKNRRGKIRITWTGNVRDSGTVITTSADSFYLNNIFWSYTHKETNIGRSPMGHPMKLIEVTECKIFGNDGMVEYTSSRTREHTKGRETPMFLGDDEFLIRGTSQGKDRNGNTFSTQILKPLKFNNDCRFFSAGSLELKRNNKDIRRIEFGHGACDNEAMLYIGGIAYPIKL